MPTAQGKVWPRKGNMSNGAASASLRVALSSRMLGMVLGKWVYDDDFMARPASDLERSIPDGCFGPTCQQQHKKQNPANMYSGKPEMSSTCTADEKLVA